MSWEKVKLGDITDSCLGKMLDQQKNHGEYQPYLANVNVRWGSFDLDNLPQMRFEETEQERYGLQYGDLVICEGGEPGRCAIWKEQIPNMKIQKALHRVRVHDGLDYRYLYYWFLWAGKRGVLDQYFTGATIKHMPGQKLKEIVIDRPSIAVQGKIADILSAYDNLIENNQKQIKLLEEAAQRIYKEWFVDLRFPGYETTSVVDGVPEGWRRGTLKELISINYGKDHKNAPDDGDIPVYGSGGLIRKCNKSLFTGEAVLIPRKGSLNHIMYVNESFWTVDTMFYATEKQECTMLFVYFFVSSHDMYAMNIGAAVPYQLYNYHLIPLVNDSELKEIEAAATTRHNSVNRHIEKAWLFFSNRKSPDYENSVKESISAVEAMCCIITGLSGSQATLGAAIKKLKDNGIHIHGAMESAFSSLYGYTSDETGIRHGGIDFKDAPAEDAKYMLISCSAFVNYLIEKWTKVNSEG